MDTVSYTHLDVYKRQVQKEKQVKSVPKVQKVKQVKLVRKVQKENRARLARKVQKAVSYTHLFLHVFNQAARIQLFIK